MVTQPDERRLQEHVAPLAQIIERASSRGVAALSLLRGLQVGGALLAAAFDFGNSFKGSSTAAHVNAEDLGAHANHPVVVAAAAAGYPSHKLHRLQSASSVSRPLHNEIPLPDEGPFAKPEAANKPGASLLPPSARGSTTASLPPVRRAGGPGLLVGLFNKGEALALGAAGVPANRLVMRSAPA
jgi:hypothetical protein